MKNLGDNISISKKSWSFEGDIAKNFDEHVSKSVPLYNEGHTLIREISDFFVNDETAIYDIGCSTGKLIHDLALRHSESKARFIGIDPVEKMVKFASERCKGMNNVEFLVNDIVEMDLEATNLIVSYYTMQFISPKIRQQAFNRIYNALDWGGAFVFFEKVRAPDARFQDIISQIYAEYKVSRGYSAEEILSKSQSLKGVLEPFSTEGNLGLAKRAGFTDIMTIFKYGCFEGFLAIK